MFWGDRVLNPSIQYFSSLLTWRHQRSNLPSGYRDCDTVWLLQKGIYGLKQAGGIRHEGIKADMEELGLSNAPGTMPSSALEPGGATTWKTCIGSRQQLNRMEEMFSQRYGIIWRRELRWTLDIKVNRDREAHIVSLSQKPYIDILVR